MHSEHQPMRVRINDLLIRRHIEAQRPSSKKETRVRVAVTAAALVLGAGNTAFAQAAGGDILGITPVETAFIAFLDIVAVIGIGWGFAKLMTGRHTVEGLFAMGVGVLGIAKASTIVTFLGA